MKIFVLSRSNYYYYLYYLYQYLGPYTPKSPTAIIVYDFTAVCYYTYNLDIHFNNYSISSGYYGYVIKNALALANSVYVCKRVFLNDTPKTLSRVFLVNIESGA